MRKNNKPARKRLQPKPQLRTKRRAQPKPLPIFNQLAISLDEQTSPYGGWSRPDESELYPLSISTSYNFFEDLETMRKAFPLEMIGYATMKAMGLCRSFTLFPEELRPEAKAEFGFHSVERIERVTERHLVFKDAFLSWGVKPATDVSLPIRQRLVAIETAVLALVDVMMNSHLAAIGAGASAPAPASAPQAPKLAEVSAKSAADSGKLAGAKEGRVIPASVRRYLPVNHNPKAAFQHLFIANNAAVGVLEINQEFKGIKVPSEDFFLWWRDERGADQVLSLTYGAFDALMRRHSWSSYKEIDLSKLRGNCRPTPK